LLPSTANVQSHSVSLQLELYLCCCHTLQAFQKADDESYNLQLSTTNEKPLSSVLFMVPSQAITGTPMLVVFGVTVRREARDTCERCCAVWQWLLDSSGVWCVRYGGNLSATRPARLGCGWSMAVSHE